MATMDDILGNGGGTPPLKGSKEWHEQQQDAPSRIIPGKGYTEMDGTTSSCGSCRYRLPI
ncbi:hypothetical protein NXX91_27045 [Bacteroides thetaiotaomicron]|nr:hypothetical protein [Bacteroides thetaiotaomicron]